MINTSAYSCLLSWTHNDQDEEDQNSCWLCPQFTVLMWLPMKKGRDYCKNDRHSHWMIKMRKISIHVDSPHTSEWEEQQIEAQCESLEATSGNLRTLLFILIMLQLRLRMMMMVNDYGDNDDYCSSYMGSSQKKISASKWSNRNWTPSTQFEEYFQVNSKALLHIKKTNFCFSLAPNIIWTCLTVMPLEGWLMHNRCKERREKCVKAFII